MYSFILPHAYSEDHLNPEHDLCLSFTGQGGEEEALPSLCITSNAVITELRHWLLQRFSQFLCQHQKGLFLHMQYRPNALILVFLQSAEGWQELERGRWKGTCQCYKAEQIFFHSSGWTA